MNKSKVNQQCADVARMMWCGDLEMMMLAKVDVELTSDRVMSLMTLASKDDRVAMCG